MIIQKSTVLPSGEERLDYTVNVTKTGKITSIKGWKLYSYVGGTLDLIAVSPEGHSAIKEVLEASNSEEHKALLAKW